MIIDIFLYSLSNDMREILDKRCRSVIKRHHSRATMEPIGPPMYTYASKWSEVASICDHPTLIYCSCISCFIDAGDVIHVEVNNKILPARVIYVVSLKSVTFYSNIFNKYLSA